MSNCGTPECGETSSNTQLARNTAEATISSVSRRFTEAYRGVPGTWETRGSSARPTRSWQLS